MQYHVEDEYVRDFSFEPEIILRRKDSLHIQREKYQHRKRQKRRKQFKQRQIVAISTNYDPYEAGPSSGGGCGSLSPSDFETSYSQGDVSPVDTIEWINSDDLDSDDKEEIQRSPVDIELEEFYYVS